jgi:hypothetical protein
MQMDAYVLLSKAKILARAHMLDDGSAEAKTCSRYPNVNNKMYKS